jgi:translation initiation factor 3 subunit E
MTKLKELIDANTFAPVLQQMQQRAWLMHWGLYVFFNHENGRNLIVDTLFQDRHATVLSMPIYRPLVAWTLLCLLFR